jgi:hypothetical protein
MTAAEFPGFCHISEYGEDGYAQIKDMLLITAPLTLWSPSSTLLISKSDLSPREFINLVDEGFIRVIGREEWLTSAKFRNEHKFQHARWNAAIDDRLKVFAEEDKTESPERRRVVVAPPADGYEWAEARLERRRGEIKRWNQVYRHAPEKLPTGTLDTISQNLEERKTGASEAHTVAKTILRDVRNHGKAIESARSEISLHLNRVDIAFLGLLST